MYGSGVPSALALFSALLSLPPQIRAAPLTPRATSKATYISNGIDAAGVLNGQWYSQSTGRWENLWWNSANSITTLAGLAQVDPTYASTANGIFQNTFATAPGSNGGTWLNDYYDDEGWWAMAWIKVYDLTGNGTYLSTAESIFEDLKTGLNATCGGQWWSKDKNAINSINNELYLAVGASLANRVSGKQSYYQQYATAQASWLLGAGLINSNNNFVDGLTVSQCTPEGAVWSYNQGVILGALVEMNKLTGDSSYLDTATSIAQGTIAHLTQNGILTDTAEYPDEDNNAEQFKGVFARNLAILQTARADANYVSFLQNNADSIWASDRQSNGFIGADWQGPVVNVSAPAQSSALDCLVAAASVSS